MKLLADVKELIHKNVEEMKITRKMRVGEILEGHDCDTDDFEELDDNMFWLLDKWFERNERQAQEFIELIVKCKQDGQKNQIA